jgi:hypothetical protein
MWEKYVTNVVLALFPITLLNFVVFAGICYYLGGSALNGKIVSEHYYVGEHGHYTEVSHGVFIFSILDGCFTFSTFVLVLGLAFLLEIKGKKYFLHGS